MTKVTIPREVADAIETLRKGDETSAFSNSDIAYKYADTPDRGVTATAIRKIPFDTLMRALLDGYERELTEEEARFEMFRDLYSRHYMSESDVDNAYAAGMVQAIITLGVDIPGVNIPEGGAA